MGIYSGHPARFVWVTCLSLTLCTSLPYNSAQADQQHELENLRKRIAAVQREMDETSETKSEATDALRESERAISDINRKLIELTVKRRAADHNLSKLQIEQKKLSSAMASQHVLLGNLLHHQYLGGRQEYFKLVLNNQNPSHIARDLQYYNYIARSRATWLTRLRADFSVLDTVSKDARAQRLELDELRTQQAAQKDSLGKQKQARKKMLLKISAQLRLQRREMSRLQRNENRLAQLVEKITEMLAQPESQTIFRNDKLPDNRFDSSPFNLLQGKLALPVRGVITNRFGSQRPDSTVRWKGLFVRTSSGQAVKAIAAGQVVFADWMRGFGNLLIVDHGEGYMSLYGYNESLHKQVGDILHGGDTIAVVGNSGGSEVSGLYFELRHKSKPLDPIQWLAVKQH
ncbi:MAG: peptidoglycan DD-metalloendopeptidase family protein [Gallionella sp.]